MESAIVRTVASSTRLANLFQLFQPIGGVRASPLSATLCNAGRELRAGIAPSPAGAGTAALCVGGSGGRRRVGVFRSSPTRLPSYFPFGLLFPSLIVPGV